MFGSIVMLSLNLSGHPSIINKIDFQKWKIIFLSLKNKLSDVNKTYIDICNEWAEVWETIWVYVFILP